MNIPADISAFNDSGLSLESKSIGFFMRAFMLCIMNTLLMSSNCLLKMYVCEGTFFLSFLSDADVTTISEDFYGFYEGNAMNAKSAALGARSSPTYAEQATDLLLPKVHVFGCFKDLMLKTMNSSKAMALFMDHCAVFLALANPSKSLTFGLELQFKMFNLVLSPWKGQRQFKCAIGEERYGSSRSSSSSSSSSSASSSSSSDPSIIIKDLLAVSSIKFVPGYSILDSGIEGPIEVFELALGSRAASPIFMTQYFLNESTKTYYRVDSEIPSTKFDESIFKRALALVSDLTKKNFGTSIFPGIYYSKSNELFEIGMCEGTQILGLNIFSRDLKDAPDTESFLVSMAADFIDRAFNLGSALVRYVSLRQPPNMDMCVECMSRGTLLCCDKCPRSYCLACLNMDTMPEADSWECPKHTMVSAVAEASSYSACASSSSSAAACSCSSKPAPEPLSFSAIPREKLKRPRPQKPEAFKAEESLDVSSWQFDTSIQQSEYSDAYLMSMMPHAFDESVQQQAEGGAGYGHMYPESYADSYDLTSGHFSSSSQGVSKKPRPKAIKKPRKDEDNLLKQAFDVILETSPAVEVPSVYPVLPTPFFGMSADDTYKHFPSGMPYVRETVKQAILNKKFKIAKPGGGASAGGNVREIGPKISWLQRDLEVCALLGFCAHDVYELYLESDEQARQREGTSSRGVCFVFKK